MRVPHPFLLLIGAAVLASGCSVVQDGLQPPSQQRPGISSSTSTTVHGQLDFEGGFTTGDGWEIPTVLRWGSGDGVETFAELDLWRNRTGGEGVGDLGIGVRQRIAEDLEGGTAWAYQLRTKLPTASQDDGLGSGVVDFDIAAIRDTRVRDTWVTTYYELGFVGDPDASGADLQHTLAVASSVPVTRRWNAFWEVAGRYAPNANVSEMAITLAGTYQVSPLGGFDVGVRLGLGGSARDHLVFVGIGRSLGRLIGSGGGSGSGAR